MTKDRKVGGRDRTIVVSLFKFLIKFSWFLKTLFAIWLLSNEEMYSLWKTLPYFLIVCRTKDQCYIPRKKKKKTTNNTATAPMRTHTCIPVLNYLCYLFSTWMVLWYIWIFIWQCNACLHERKLGKQMKVLQILWIKAISFLHFIMFWLSNK